MNFDATTFTNFIIGSLYFYLFILFLFTLYLGWRSFNKKRMNKQKPVQIEPKVAKEMAKKITEEAAMHRKERQEEKN